MLDQLKALALSKRFQSAVALIILALFKDGLPISEDQLTLIVASVMAWIVGDSIRPTFGKPTAMLLFALCLSGSAFAQVTSKVDSVFVLRGIDGYEVVAGMVVIPQDSKPVVTQVGLVDVESDAAIIRVTAEDAKRQPVETKDIGAGSFLILGSGQIWVRITCVDFDKKIFEDSTQTVQIGDDALPEPVDPDVPDVPTPTVPDDQFDNLGQRVAGWSAGIPGRKPAAAIYRKSAEMLRSDPSQTVNSVSSYLVGELAKLIDYPKMADVRKNINADLQQRWSASPMSRGVLADYYSAIATGLEAE